MIWPRGRFVVRRLWLAHSACTLNLKSLRSPFTKMHKATQNWGGLRSFCVTLPFDRAHTISYSNLIETMRLYLVPFLRYDRFPTSHRWTVHIIPKSTQNAQNAILPFLSVKVLLIAHQIWHSSVKGGRYRSPQKSKFAKNCGFRPPEANTINTFSWKLACKPSTSPSLPSLLYFLPPSLFLSLHFLSPSHHSPSLPFPLSLPFPFPSFFPPPSTLLSPLFLPYSHRIFPPSFPTLPPPLLPSSPSRHPSSQRLLAFMIFINTFLLTVL